MSSVQFYSVFALFLFCYFDGGNEVSGKSVGVSFGVTDYKMVSQEGIQTLELNMFTQTE